MTYVTLPLNKVNDHKYVARTILEQKCGLDSPDETQVAEYTDNLKKAGHTATVQRPFFGPVSRLQLEDHRIFFKSFRQKANNNVVVDQDILPACPAKIKKPVPPPPPEKVPATQITKVPVIEPKIPTKVPTKIPTKVVTKVPKEKPIKACPFGQVYDQAAKKCINPE